MTFRFRGTAFQTTVAQAGSRQAAEVIARACWMKFEEGKAKEEVKRFREECYQKVKKAQPSDSLAKRGRP